MQSSSTFNFEAPTPSVNAHLQSYQDSLDALTGLRKVGNKTYSAVGFGGNINFIEGVDGVIVVNTGTTLTMSQQALDLYRKISDKPIVAVAYTHGYADHTGGGRVFIPRGLESKVAVYANATWRGYVGQASSPIQPEVALRGASQVGVLLPIGPSGTVGSALTRPIQGGFGTSYIQPTVDVAHPTRLTIAGVKLEMIPAPHDVDDGMMVYMPDERILFGGDLLLLNDIYPPLATPRSEPRRDPQKWIESMALAASYPAEHLINAYGPPVSGAAEIRSRLLGQQRIAQYMVDEVYRRILAGENADAIAADFRFPDSVTLGRDYKAYYHRLSWIIRSLISREFGHFSGDVLDLVKLPPREEARQFAEEFGGIEQLMARAAHAYEGENYRWSMQLATLVLKLEPSHDDAAKLRRKCMRAIAYLSDSANERNYLLSAAAMEAGEIDRKMLLRLIGGMAPSDIALSKPPAQMLQVMGIKLKARDDGQRPIFSVQFVLTDKPDVFQATILPALMLRNANPDGSPADLELKLSHEALIRGIEGMNSFVELRESGAIDVTKGQEYFDRFVDAFEW